jgi:hypothetical protein
VPEQVPGRLQQILRRALILPLVLFSLLALLVGQRADTKPMGVPPQARIRPQLARRQQAASPARRSS